MANDTNLYKILSSLYQGEVKINNKLTGSVDALSTVIGSDYVVGEGEGKFKDVKTRLADIETRLTNVGGTLADTTAGAEKNGLIAGAGQSDISITNGVVTVNAAGKVKHGLTFTGINSPAFDGSADLTITSSDIVNWTKSALATDAAGLALAKDVYDADHYLSGVIDGITVEKLANATAGYAASYQLKVKGAAVGDTIDIVKDQFLKQASLVYSTSENAMAGESATKTDTAKFPFLKFELYTNTGTESPTTTSTVYIPVNALFDDYTAGNGLQEVDQTFSIKLDADNESKFLTVGANGLKLSGVQDAINAANSDALTELHALSGQVSGAFGAGDYLVVSKEGKIEKSTFTIGADNDTITSSSADNVVATEKAVAAAIKVTQDKLDALSGNIDDSFVANEVAIGKADRTGLTTSGKTLGGATLAETPVATVLATEAAVKDADDTLYTKIVNTDLADLWTKVNAFNTGLGPDVNL